MATPIKVSLNGVVRRLLLDLTSVQTIERGISEAFQLTPGSFSLAYLDDDKEVISLPPTSSQQELEAFKNLHGQTRLIVNLIQAAASTTAATANSKSGDVQMESPATFAEATKEKEMEEEETKRISWADVLSNREFVEAVQQAIASPVIADFVVKVGETLGEEGNVLEVLINQGPLVHAVFNEVLERFPQVKELLGDDVTDAFMHQGMKFCRRAQRCGGGRNGGHGWGRHCRRRQWAHQQEEEEGVRPIHVGVTCDGCSANEDLRAISVRDGFLASEGGYIMGIRFKSASVENYDLCESCEASGYFQASHGPFLKIERPFHSPFEMLFMRRHHGWGGRRWRDATDADAAEAPWRRRKHHWHEAQQCATQNTASSSTTTSASAPSAPPASASAPAPSQVSQKESFDKLVQQGFNIFETFVKAASAPPADATTTTSTPASAPAKTEDGVIPEKWKSKIELLQTLGFMEWSRYVPILEQEGGDLERTIGRILSLQA